jgi:hypothetical protein
MWSFIKICLICIIGINRLMDGLEPYLTEMFLARSLSSVVTFCSDRPPFKMAAVTKNRNFFNCPFFFHLIYTDYAN